VRSSSRDCTCLSSISCVRSSSCFLSESRSSPVCQYAEDPRLTKTEDGSVPPLRNLISHMVPATPCRACRSVSGDHSLVSAPSTCVTTSPLESLPLCQQLPTGQCTSGSRNAYMFGLVQPADHCYHNRDLCGALSGVDGVDRVALKEPPRPARILSVRQVRHSCQYATVASSMRREER